MRLISNCQICGKPLALKSSVRLGPDRSINTYKCGHIFTEDTKKVEVEDNLDFTSANGKFKARPYQEDGVKFMVGADFNCILADQMRIGKTPQTLLALKNRIIEKTPTLILVRSANLWQWVWEYKAWCNSLPNGIWVIQGTKGIIPHGFSAYIISMDTFSRNGMTDRLVEFGFKLVIADEAQSFKNPESNRSQQLVEFMARINGAEIDNVIKFSCTRCKEEWEEKGKVKFDKRIGHKVTSKSSQCPKCGNHVYISQRHDESDKWVDSPAAGKIRALLELAANDAATQAEKANALEKADFLKHKHSVPENLQPCGIVLLTGTPIMNAADEFFIPLNLVAPDRFHSLEGFRRTWLEQDTKGKWKRIKPYYLQSFKETIKPYYLRREKEDVFTELPKLNRIFTVINPEKDTLTKQYNKILDQLEGKLASKIDPNYWDMQTELMALRRICALMKAPWVCDYIDTCLEDNTEKYAIGIHHEDVRDLLYYKLGSSDRCHRLSGSDNAEAKFRIMKDFEHDDKRVLVMNMLAGGVGMDFHYVNNVVILERQWNSAVEEQFEFRFYNPDKTINPYPTTCEYVLIKGSIEQFFYEMVEEKRQIFGETVGNHWNLEQDSKSFRQLVEETLGSRL